MEPAQSSMMRELLAPLAMLGCTTVIAFIGWLLSRQMKQVDRELAENRRESRENSDRIHDFEIAWAAQFGQPPPKRHGSFKVAGGDSA